MNNDKNQKLDGFTIGILILAAFGLIIMIAEISEAIDETKKERAYWDNWQYEHIQKGADEYNRNHVSSNNNTTKRKSSSKTDYSTKTVDPSDHDIDTYYEDYKDEFEDEDDAWDDFEDNEEYWDDY